MDFQLVRASDTEIVVWHKEHGHIFMFDITPQAHDLSPGRFRNMPEALRDAASLQDEARAFAAGEARSRRLIV